MSEEKPISGNVLQPDQVLDDGTRPGDDAEEIKAHPSYTQGRRGKTPERSEGEAAQEARDRNAFALVAFEGGFNWDASDKDRVATEDEKRLVRTMAFAGFTQDQISSAVKIPKQRLARLFAFELQNARVIMVSEIAGSLAFRARSGSDSAAIFLLKTRGGDTFKQISYVHSKNETINSADSPSQEERQKFIDKIVEMVQTSVKNSADAKPIEEEIKK